MTAKDQTSRKPVGTREWYDFIGQLAGILPGIHLGGQDATHALLEMCRLKPGSWVLDVGCGYGNSAYLIAQRYGSQVMGIDLSEVMIAQAKERASRHGLMDKVEFLVADVSQLAFDDDEFDVIIAESVLTPLSGDKKQAVKEMVRVTRKGGRIGVNEGTLDPSAPPELLALLAEHPANYGHFTPQTLRSLFVESGLQVIQMTNTMNAGTPMTLKDMGLRNLLSFMIRTYPKILLKLLGDSQLRKASRIDNLVTKRGKPYMGYSLIVGQKPG